MDAPLSTEGQRGRRAAKPSARPRPAAQLTPRAAFFGNPVRAMPIVSPDGAHLAFLAPRDGVMNVWVAPIADPAAARPLTSASGRPIADFFWAPDSRRVLYRQDVGGTENYLLYGVALGETETRCYTPFEKTQVNIVRVSPRVTDAILIGLNKRDARWHDVWRLEPETGALTLVWENPGGYAKVVADLDLAPVLAERAMPGGGSRFERFEADGTLTPVFEIALADSLATNVLSARDRRSVLMLDSRGRDTAALAAIDLETGKTTLIAEDARVDVGGSIKDPRTGEVQAYAVNYLTRRWRPVGAALAEDIAAIDAQSLGQWQLISQSDDNRLWTIAVERAAQVPTFHLYDRSARRLTRLFSSRPALEEATLAPMHPREIPARDGLTLVSYLSLPPGSDADGDGAPDAPLPLVLLVHGGPWGRDVFMFHPEHQWLTNRGYAVLSVNYRASTGFGKAFVSAGDLEWGRKMHDDLLDAVEWAIAAGITQRDSVAIMGGSYGGYAVLVGLAMTPGVFCCGVEIVGPSNLETLLETVPPYWGAIYEQFAQRMGDPRTEAGRALLKERSPVYYAHQIGAPLLIGQGANDVRVNQRESDQIVAALKQGGVPVTYVLYPDEGHGFRRPQNATSFYAIAEGFLAAELGGAAEPLGGDIAASSVRVLEGAELIDGLAEAAAAQVG